MSFQKTIWLVSWWSWKTNTRNTLYSNGIYIPISVCFSVVNTILRCEQSNIVIGNIGQLIQSCSLVRENAAKEEENKKKKYSNYTCEWIEPIPIYLHDEKWDRAWNDIYLLLFFGILFFFFFGRRERYGRIVHDTYGTTMNVHNIYFSSLVKLSISFCPVSST